MGGIGGIGTDPVALRTVRLCCSSFSLGEGVGERGVEFDELSVPGRGKKNTHGLKFNFERRGFRRTFKYMLNLRSVRLA